MAFCALFLSGTTFAQTNATSANVPAMTPTKEIVRAQNRRTAHAVRKALARTQALSTVDINVVAKGGKVSLFGTVSDHSQISLAGTAAATVPDVESVSNGLTVRYPGR